ncbi:hypothetical protein ACL02P_23795 [Paenibacillus sp. MB22_1]|uniref:hypothetical protein n=1 Tax=Paenibacillus sp. MB22_1 TaxID=3383121 RepID=UPI0020896AD5|nr:hypothetical protein HMSSN139_05390 [Paenibacillus sp. HMSSN-139]
MFFADEQHKTNFQRIAVKFPEVKKARDYCAACYIGSYPEIYKCFSLEKQKHGPFDWYFDYLDDPEDFVQRRDRGETSGDTAPLTGQTRRLVELGLNLWNGRDFDLSDGLNSWDHELYLVALQAIDLRRNSPVLSLAK